MLSDNAGRRTASLFVVLALLTIAPVFAAIVPPLNDYPNHLARFFILLNPRSAFLAKNYAIVWKPIPNLAGDLIVPALAHIMPLTLAGKVFIAAILLINVGGVSVLGRVVTGRWSAWTLLAFLLVYNVSFRSGFINFSFGIGVAFLAAAAWIATEDMSLAAKLLLRSLLTLLAYFCHLQACLTMALIVALYYGLPFVQSLFTRQWRETLTIVIAHGVPLVPAIALFAATWIPGVLSGHVVYRPLLDKFIQLVKVFDNYNKIVDTLTALSVALIVCIAFWKRRLRIPGFTVAWVVGFLIIYALTPDQALSGARADLRWPVIIAMLFLAGTQIDGATRRDISAFCTILVSLVGIRTAVIYKVWQGANEIYRNDVSLIDRLPNGARLAVALSPELQRPQSIPREHLPLLAVLEREAFVPTLFSNPAQQPVQLRHNIGDGNGLIGPPELWSHFVAGRSIAVKPFLQNFDYIVFVMPTYHALPLDKCLKWVANSRSLQLYRLDHSHCAA